MRGRGLYLWAWCLVTACAGRDQTAVEAGALENAPRDYIVLATTEESLPDGLAKKLTEAGGTITTMLPESGTVLVTSSSTDFAARARKLRGVRSVVRDLEVKLEEPRLHVPAGTPAPNLPSSKAPAQAPGPSGTGFVEPTDT